MLKADAKKAIRTLKKMVTEIDRAYIPNPESQNRLEALRLAMDALEHYPNFKALDEFK